MRCVALFVLLAGCSKILGIDDLHGPGSGSSDAQAADGARMDAALPDVPVSATLKISGEIDQLNPTSGQRMPVPNVPLDLRRPDDTSIVGGTTDANGKFTLTVQTLGMPVDGYLFAKGTAINAEDAYYYLRPLTADTTVTNFVLFQQQSINLLAQLCGVPADPTQAFAVAVVVAPDNSPLANVVVQAMPANGGIRYMNAQASLPDNSLTATSASGLALVFDVKPATAQHFTGSVPGKMGTFDVTTKAVATYYVPLVVQ